jgi:hypothetical protein
LRASREKRKSGKEKYRRSLDSDGRLKRDNFKEL